MIEQSQSQQADYKPLEQIVAELELLVPLMTDLDVERGLVFSRLIVKLHLCRGTTAMRKVDASHRHLIKILGKMGSLEQIIEAQQKLIACIRQLE